MPRSIIALAVSVLSAAGVAALTVHAADPPSVVPPDADGADMPQFSVLDVNHDTRISAEEARRHARLAAIFAECDSDKNGSLSTWEFAEARSKLTQ